jgi:hypothetical protein
MLKLSMNSGINDMFLNHKVMVRHIFHLHAQLQIIDPLGCGSDAPLVKSSLLRFGLLTEMNLRPKHITPRLQ